MKNSVIIIMFFLICVNLNAQSLDLSEYEETDLFSYRVEEIDYGEWGRYRCSFQMYLYFDRQRSTTVYFYDENGDEISMSTRQRYSLERGQRVTVYFQARRTGWNDIRKQPYGNWVDVTIDYLEIVEQSP